jgi:trk system potassium uptake protein TrkH
MSPHNPLLKSPGRLLIGSMLILIGLGALILSLPLCQRTPVSFTDALFTATSATCITGLFTVPIDAFNWIGHWVILVLIQIGGLGLVTLTVFFMSFFVEVGLGTQIIAGRLLEIESWSSSKRIIAFIMVLTVVCEAIGTLLLYFTLPSTISSRFFFALFHSISAFCSAGISLLPDSLVYMNEFSVFLTILMALMFIGGIGFFTWFDLFAAIRAWYMGKHPHLSLHTRIIFSMSIGIIVLSAITIFFLEFNEGFAQLSLKDTIVNSLFSAFSWRSAGFTTVDITSLHLATFLLIMIISFIGSAPGSTGSGIKITTFSLTLAAITSVLSGRTEVDIKKRRIPNDQVFKALAILSLSLGWVGLTTFLLLVTQESWRFVDIMLESFSAFANLGLSSGVTPYLTTLGKWIIMTSMVFGRVGLLTILLALKKRQEKTEFHYPEERVMLS